MDNKALKYTLYILGGGLLLWGLIEFMKPVGVRCNNPGNLKKNGSSLITYASLLADVQDDPVYLKFKDPASGVLAMAHLLLGYNAQGLNTITDIINKYAPPSENDTQAYIDFIVKQTGLSATIPFDFGVDSLGKMVQAQITYEQGWGYIGIFQPYITEEVSAAVTAYPNLA